MAIVILATYMILQASALTINYSATATYAHKQKLHRRRLHLALGELYLTFRMIFGVRTGAHNYTQATLTNDQGDATLQHCTQYLAISHVGLNALH